MIRRPAALCILDGWGLAADGPANAIGLARTPVWDRLTGGFPNARIAASGEAVGLPDGQMGNSEVGHMTIGSGRAVLQDLPRIDAAIRDGSLAASPVLGRFVARLRRSGGRCHLAGLASPGGVHAHTAHMLALARCIAGAGVPVAVHAFLDGRDTPPRSARDHIAAFEAAAAAGPPGVTVATVCGRYFAMDRDGNWERTARAFAATARAEGVRAESAAAAVEASYAANAGDEFVAPTVIDGYGGMEDGDGFVMANFRADRARQILAALLAPDFAAFARGRPPCLCRCGGNDALFRISGRADGNSVPARGTARHPRRPRRHGGPATVQGRRNREIRARHLFPQWRARGTVPRRGAVAGAFAEGRDL